MLQAVARVLGVYGEELSLLRDQLDTYQDAKQARPHVTFQDTHHDALATDFLSCFECQLQREELQTDGEADGDTTRTNLHIVIRTTLSEARYNKLGI